MHGTNCREILRPIKRIVLFPVHLKQFSWVGRKVFLFFILYNFACKIHGVRGKKFGFNILFVQIVVKSLQSAGLLLGRSDDRKQDYSFDRPYIGCRCEPLS